MGRFGQAMLQEKTIATFPRHGASERRNRLKPSEGRLTGDIRVFSLTGPGIMRPTRMGVAFRLGKRDQAISALARTRDRAEKIPRENQR